MEHYFIKERAPSEDEAISKTKGGRDLFLGLYWEEIRISNISAPKTYIEHGEVVCIIDIAYYWLDQLTA